jgi:hypothetical protein
MCGLAGILRQADGNSLELAREMTDQLVGTIEDRGSHATGIAITHIDAFDNPFVWKTASKASVVRASEPWQKILDQEIDASTVAIQLHTRRASHDNASRDDCAHPFQIGNVVGCHNGIISNWKKVEQRLVKDKLVAAQKLKWKVDSEAVFALLDVNEDPLAALEQVEGYFALSWTKGEHLYLARSQQGVLAYAWIPNMKMLVWNSLGTNIVRVLKRHGFKPKDYTIRELPADRALRINMARFAQGQPAQKTLEADRSWGTLAISRGDAERWTGSSSRESYSMDQMRPYTRESDEPAKLISLRDLQDRIEKLEARVQTLQKIIVDQKLRAVEEQLSLDMHAY